MAKIERNANKQAPAQQSMALELFAEGELLPPVADEASKLLPEWGEKNRGVPNAILKSALFAAISPNNRKQMKRELVLEEYGFEIRFTGLQLDQSDLDLWETMVHISRHTPKGEKFYFKPHQVLAHMGRSQGGEQFTWLTDALDRMVACSVNVTIGGKFTYSSNMLTVWTDEHTGERAVILDEGIFSLYSQGWSEINWAQRDALRKKPLALWLHGWYSSQACPETITVEQIYQRCGSNAKSKTSFKACVKQALAELVEVGTLQDFAISRDGKVTSRKDLVPRIHGF
jgi:hypothetical protein